MLTGTDCIDHPARETALRNVHIAMAMYTGMARRPRTATAWAYVETTLWNARQDAIRSGVMARGSNDHDLISARLTDARQRRELGRRLEDIAALEERSGRPSQLRQLALV